MILAAILERACGSGADQRREWAIIERNINIEHLSNAEID